LAQAQKIVSESEANEVVFKLEKLFSHNQVQEFLVEMTDIILDKHFQAISTDNVMKLLACLHKASKEARDTNS
jgi:uncharacterized protein YccT (UPF0319 family)